MWCVTCNKCFDDTEKWNGYQNRRNWLSNPQSNSFIIWMTLVNNPYRRHANSSWMKAKFHCELFNPFSITVMALLRIPSWSNWFSLKSIAQWFKGAIGSYLKTTAHSKVEMFYNMVDCLSHSLSLISKYEVSLSAKSDLCLSVIINMQFHVIFW